ncbi:MFS transporter [Salinithrix halophila]|uniref:MFS transporter n=1 Tax=Salinithrix halophila TaxID=1485204 RepID=A0ABV8JAK3_9BACL
MTMISIQQRILIITIASGVFASVMSTSMLSIAFPDLVRAFTIDYETLQVRNILFFTFFAVGLPFFGKITDRVGPRVIFLTGLALFILSCVMSATMTQWGGFLFFQSTQALADAMIVPATVTLIRHQFPETKMGWAFGWFSATLALATIIGPALGGLILKTYEWTMLFYVLAFCSLISFLFAWIRIPHNESETNRGEKTVIPWFSGLSLGAGMILFQFFMLEPARKIMWLGIALLAIGLFLYSEKHHAPLLPKRFYRNVRFLNACIRVFLLFMVVNTIALYGPSYLRDVHHWPPDKVGWVILIDSVIGVSIASLAGKAADRNPLLTMGTGIGISIIGTALFLWTVFGHSYLWIFLLIYLLSGLGSTLTMPSQNKIAMTSVPKEQTGNYMGLFQMIQFITGAFAAGAFGSFVEGEKTGQISSSGFSLTILISVGLLIGALCTVWFDRHLTKKQAEEKRSSIQPLP